MATVTALERETLNSLGYSDWNIDNAMTDATAALILQTSSPFPDEAFQFITPPPKQSELFLQGVGEDAESITMYLSDSLRKAPKAVSGFLSGAGTFAKLALAGVVIAGILMLRKVV